MLSIAVIVVAAGFSIGIIAGLAWEEPGLVLGYVSGNSDSIAWQSRSDEDVPDPPLTTSEAPPVAAAPPAAPKPRLLGERASSAPPRLSPSAAPPVTPPPAPPREKPVVAKAASRTGFAVQVGAFGESSAAKRLADRLRGKGYSVYIAGPGQGDSWRVRVGPVSTREEAERVAGRLEKGEKLPTWVLSEDS
jgi:cell division septation protein DedD